MIEIQNKTLEQLDGENWGEPPYQSGLVLRTYSLRKKPLEELTTEDLRLMIGQNFSLDYLIPIAIEKLKENILAEGNFYPGDLLQNVLRIEHRYWIDHVDQYKVLKRLYEDRHAFIQSRVTASEFQEPIITQEIADDLESSFLKFASALN